MLRTSRHLNSSPPTAPTRSDEAAYTQYVVRQAIERYDAEGRDAALDYHNSPESLDGEWYVFIADSGEVPPRTAVAGYTQYLVHRAIERYAADGRDAVAGHHSDPATVDGQWYVFITDGDGTFIGHPVRDDLLGTDVADLVDVNGKAYGEEIAAAGESGAWVGYYYVDPRDGETRRKHSWVIRYDGLLIGSGWYTVPEPETDEPMPTVTGPAEDTATG